MPKRDATIDIVRGIAVVIMIGANMGPFLQEPHPWPMRLYSSLAAPTFVLLAGMMVGYGSGTKSWGAVCRRSAMLLFWAVFTDVVAWRIRPFLGMDVLYLVAVGTLATFGLRKLRSLALAGVITLIVVATPILQHVLGYSAYPTERTLFSGTFTDPTAHPTSLWHHYVIDGWFPVFPWVAYMLVGLILSRLRGDASQTPPKAGRMWGMVAGGLLAMGTVLWCLQPGAAYDRRGFSELFYPPTIGFIVTSVGAVLALFGLAGATRKSCLWYPVRTLGQHSLVVYVAHSVVIGRLLGRWFHQEPVGPATFSAVYATFVASMFVLVLAWRRLHDLIAGSLARRAQ